MEDSSYSNLMKYLESIDTAVEEIAPPAPTSSSSSRSVLKSPIRNTSSTYIWDDPKSVESSYTLDTHRSKSSKEVITSLGDEVRGQLRDMKNQIKDSKDQAKELQAEFVRLCSVRQKRMEKKQSHFNSLLMEQSKEQSDALKKQEDFVSKLRTDVEALRKKKLLLLDRLKSSQESRELQLAAAVKACKLKKNRWWQQLEAEDKQVMDKAVQAKLPAMKRAAGDSFGPKLDELVRSGKLEVSRLIEEHEGKLKVLAVTLESEGEAKLQEIEKQLRSKAAVQTSKEKQDAQKRISETKARYAQELQEVMDDALMEKDRVTKSAKKQKEMALHELQRSIQNVRERNAKALEETLFLQGEELKRVSQQLHEERDQLRSRLAEDKKRWRNTCLERHAKDQAVSLEKMKAQLLAEMSRSKTDAIKVVMADIENERAELKKKFDVDLEACRRSLADESIGSSGGDVSERMKSIRREVDGLRLDTTLYAEQLRGIDSETKSSKAKAKQLLEQISVLESRMSALEDADEIDVENESIAMLNRSKAKLRNALTSIASEKQNLYSDLERETNLERKKHQEEMARINDKVAMILRRKDADIAEAQRKHDQLTAEVAELSAELERLRDSALN